MISTQLSGSIKRAAEVDDSLSNRKRQCTDQSVISTGQDISCNVLQSTVRESEELALPPELQA
jgi:hypothetical protein